MTTDKQSEAPPRRAEPAHDRSEARRLVVHKSDGQFHTAVNPSDISELIGERGTFLWLDLQNPQDQGVELLREEFEFHPLSIEDATRHHERPKLEAFEKYYFLVFYCIGYDKSRERLFDQPINLFIGANYIVSVHHDPIGSIDETLRRWQANAAEFGSDAGALLYNLLNVLIRREVPVFERNTILYLQDVYDHIVRITDSIDTYRDLLSSALDAFLSVQSNRLNQIVKILTIASIVLMSDAL